MISLSERHADHRDAEKDLAFSLVALQEGRLAKAVLNTALALHRMTRCMHKTEWSELFAALEALKLEIAARDKPTEAT